MALIDKDEYIALGLEAKWEIAFDLIDKAFDIALIFKPVFIFLPSPAFFAAKFVDEGTEQRGRAGAQYISLKRLLKSSLSKRIKYFDKVEKPILRLKGLRWRHIALLRFVLVVNLLDLPSIDTQKTRW